MILKVNMLLDANDDMVTPTIINALLNQVFEDNAHLAKLMVCDTEINERKHEWQFYMNGSFCKNCGVPIGSSQPCR